MKKIISIMITALMAFGMVACTDASHNNITDESSTIEEMNEPLSDADIYEIKPAMEYTDADITMIPFCTSGSSSIGNSGKNLAENAGSGNWLEGKRFDVTVSESEIKDWISGIQK